jgi:hypothetical protein
MRRRALIGGIAAALAFGTLAFGTAAFAAEKWPALPAKGFVTGRPAQPTDVDDGNAIFVASRQGKVVGKPLAIAIPQYAILTEPNLQVIVVQGEEVNGEQVFGVRDLAGGEYVVKAEHIQLLGTKKPK